MTTILGIVGTAVVFLVILIVLVVAHELGHFLMAKLFGVNVEEFGIGYPPRAKKLFVWKGTLFTLNWLPLGGFVKIFGEDSASVEGSSALENSFSHQPISKRALILLGGVIANMVIAMLIFAGIGGGWLFSFKLFGMIVHSMASMIGTAFSGGGSVLSNLAGPIGIAKFSGQAAREGIIPLLSFTGVISVNLAVVNLLPFPALDGGRLLLELFSHKGKSKISPKIIEIINQTGFILIIILLLVVTYHDLRGVL